MTGMVPWQVIGSLVVAAVVATPQGIAVPRADETRRVATPMPQVFGFQGRPATAHAEAAWDDRRGAAVALSGDVLLVGAPGDSLSIGDRAGSVLVYRRGPMGWALDSKLVPPTPRQRGGFGTAVAVDGSTAVIGTTTQSGTSSAAFVFVHDGLSWRLQATLEVDAPPGARVAGLGSAVALKGTRVLIGAPGTSFGTTAPVGAAFVFDRSGDTWTQQATLRAPQDAPEGTLHFGGAVALSDGAALIGTRSPSGGIRGEAYAFPDDGGGAWGPAQRLVPPVPLPANAGFGSSIAVAGDLAVVSAPWAPAHFVFRRASGQWQPQSTIGIAGQAAAIAPPYVYIGNPGAVTAFEINVEGTTWQSLGALDPPPGTGSFGAALSADGSRVAVGAPDSIPAGQSLPTGAASVYGAALGAVALEQHFEQAFGPIDRFGEAVAIAGDSALVGAPSGGSLASQGVVHWLHRRNGRWTSAGTMQPPVAQALLAFGSSIALLNDRALIGAPGFNQSGTGGNRTAWIFQRTSTGWVIDAALSIPEDPTFDRYGTAVALSGDWAFVGAPATRLDDADTEGAVHVFTATPAGWVRQQILRPPNNPVSSAFGTAIAAAGDLLLVGAPSTSALNPGAVYVFQRMAGGWLHLQTLDGEVARSRFGSAIYFDGANAWIGAPFTARGSVYRFPWTGGRFNAPQRIDAAAASTGFGQAIGGGGGHVLIGAPTEGFGGQSPTIPGSVYLVGRVGDEWTINAGIAAIDLSPLAQGVGFAVAAVADAIIVGAPRSGSQAPFGNPSEGAAFIIEAPPLFADGFEP